VSYPPLEPYEHGMLDTGDGNLVYWEACGNPHGVPALVLHGGPGSGCTPGMRRLFDPDRYRIVLFDQRGCGRSRPHASDPTTSLLANTTAHLITDIELLREALGVPRWLLFGGSWGSTLALAYAQTYPARVSQMVLVSVTTTRPAEIDWLYCGVARFLPQQWEQFRDALPAERRYDMVAGYAAMMEHPDPAERMRYAKAWCAWEDAVISHESSGRPGRYSAKSAQAMLAFVRICSRYFANAAWLDDDALLAGARTLAGIPGVLIHGRLDLGSPLDTAWQLAKAWPSAQLHIVDDAGHTGNATTGQLIRQALDSFAAA
jgi:proline iminopeptidase